MEMLAKRAKPRVLGPAGNIMIVNRCYARLCVVSLLLNILTCIMWIKSFHPWRSGYVSQTDYLKYVSRHGTLALFLQPHRLALMSIQRQQTGPDASLGWHLGINAWLWHNATAWKWRSLGFSLYSG